MCVDRAVLVFLGSWWLHVAPVPGGTTHGLRQQDAYATHSSQEAQEAPSDAFSGHKKGLDRK